MSFSDRLDKWPRLKHAYLLGIGWWAVLVAIWSLLSSADTLDRTSGVEELSGEVGGVMRASNVGLENMATWRLRYT